MIIVQIFHLTVDKRERGDGFALEVGGFSTENLKPLSPLECFFFVTIILTYYILQTCDLSKNVLS